MTPADPVARYYDRNTLRFLIAGGGARALAIHRELWGEGVRTAEEAKRYVNRLVEEQVRGLGAAPEVVDLGCGVGGTLLHLAERIPAAHLHGLTISARQAGLARRFVRLRGHGRRCRIHHGDFETLRLDVRADAAVGIEAFAHARSPAGFLDAAAAHLRVGGRLVLVDDFLARDDARLSPDERRRVELLRRGWRLSSAVTADACVGAARRSGLHLLEDRDLTPLVRPGRPRDRAVALLAPWLERLGLVDVPFFGNMIGGNALQEGLREGFLRYRMLVFERVGPAVAAS